MLNSISFNITNHLNTGSLKEKNVCHASNNNANTGCAVSCSLTQIPSAQHIKANFYSVPNIKKVNFGNNLTHAAEEIAACDVIKKINAKLDITSPKEIQEIINSFGDSARPLAAKILQKMTQFANMESLNEIAKHVKNNDGCFYEHDLIDISTIMRYLTENKDVFTDIPGHLKGKNIFYILDKVALEELETNPRFLKEIKNNPDIKIIYPEGWINGINPFNQTEPLKAKIQKFISKLPTEKSSGQDETIEKALNEEIIERIKKLGLKDRFEIIRNEELNNAPATAEQISKQLAPACINEEEMEKVINKLYEADKRLIKNYLIENTDAYSPKRISSSLKKIHGELQKNGLLDEGTYYYVPDALKSYGIIAMMYKLANKIPNNRFIYDMKKPPEGLKRVIILDDLICSGSQIAYQIVNLQNINYSEKLVIAPIISTNRAKQILAGKSTGEHPIIFCPHKTKDDLLNTDYVKSLKPPHQWQLLDLLEGLGYEHSGLSITFPYMCPDNNNLFFSREIAPCFTLNGKGIKTWEHFT